MIWLIVSFLSLPNLYLLLFYTESFFYTNFIWWLFTWVWETASFLWFPGPSEYSFFISIMPLSIIIIISLLASFSHQHQLVVFHWSLRYSKSPQVSKGSLRGVMANVLDYNIVVNKSELQTRYYVRFRTNTLGKGLNPFILPSFELNSTTTVLLQEWLCN